MTHTYVTLSTKLSYTNRAQTSQTEINQMDQHLRRQATATARSVANDNVVLDRKFPIMKKRSLTPLAVTFAIGGLWDTIAGILYIFFIGTGRMIDNPAMDPFYSIFLGSFFLCFAYLQLLSAINIERYALNVGCLILGRAFYVIQLYLYMGFVKGFPSTFWFTGVIDSTLIILYFVLAFRGGMTARDLFLPRTESQH